MSPIPTDPSLPPPPSSSPFTVYSETYETAPARADTRSFTFVAGNHSVSQSSFSNPCKDLSNGTVFSGYMPANITAGKTSSVSLASPSALGYTC